MASHEAAPAKTVSALTLGGKRSAIAHFAAAAIAALYPFLGATTMPQPVQVAQAAAGILGAVGTYLAGNRAAKVVIPLAVAVIVGMIPYLDGGWRELQGAALLAALVHVLVGAFNGMFPNDTVMLPPAQTDDGAHVVTSLPAAPVAVVAAAPAVLPVQGGATPGAATAATMDPTATGGFALSDLQAALAQAPTPKS
jgi:membrane-bound metal-dependent hydrolase YbcI (DUF457 family)